MKERLEEIEQEMQESDFWNDTEKAGEILKKSKTLEKKVERFDTLKQDHEDLHVLIQLGLEEKDESIIKEVEQLYEKVKEELSILRIETLLRGDYDKYNVYLTIHPGTGGTDAQDWAEMLLRMYTRWAEAKDYKVELVEYNRDYEGGIKNATLYIQGDNAYGYLKSEKGVHRLVRISPYNANAKRQTSFASVDVMPEIDEEIEVNINTEDLKIDTYRASGAGGQHVNKTESAIRITHLPTGLVVQCQNERSQHNNKEIAMKMLYAKLMEIAQSEHKERIEDIKGEYKESAWGSQIRSYVFHPYNLVKDHRTEEETGNVSAVMDGDLDKFMNAYLKSL